MRVSSGSLKGRKIKFTPSGRQLRPTTSKVKESVFNILAGEINGARFLDLYAGTGAVGIDALSHGASEVFFVESDRSNSKNIKQILEQTGFKEKAKVVTTNALSFIEWAEVNNLSFDIIFLDPPYHTDEIMHALSAIGGSHILGQTGLVMAEHFTKRKLPERVDRLQKIKDYIYGDTVLSLYKISDFTD